MKTPKAPPPPDPIATAAAQTQSNVQTAIANAWMGNANSYSPLGSVTYNQTGTKQIRDSSGAMIDVPQFERIEKLSPDQQKLYDQQNALGYQMNDTAGTLLKNVQGAIGNPIDPSKLPTATTSISAPTIGSGPKLQGQIGDVGGIQRSVNLNTNAPTTFADSWDIQRQVGANDFSADRQKVEDALMSRLNPQLDRDRSALESRLANQGLTMGSEAYKTAIDETNRAGTDARMQAILAGGQEQSRMFGLDLAKGQFANAAQQQDYGQKLGRGQFAQAGIAQNNAALLDMGNFANGAQQQTFGQAMDRTNLSNQAAQQMYGNATNAAQQNFQNQQTAAQFGNTARERALQEELTLRNQPINEIGALMNGGQVTMPQFSQFQAPTVQGTPVGDYIYQSNAIAQRNAQIAAQQKAATMGGLFGLGGSLLGNTALFSDPRLKRDIVRVGQRGALGLYFFRYLWDAAPRLGFMADEVARVIPEAVSRAGEFLMVDYGKVKI